MAPFHLNYTLTRRQRLAVELVPWLPAIAAAVGFTFGAAFLSLHVSRWFMLLLLLPPVVYRGLFAFAYDIAVRGGRPVEIAIDETALEMRTGAEVKRLALDGVFQVYRNGDVWTVLHLDGTVVTVPLDAITDEQIAYLRTFVRRAAAGRAAHE